MPNQCIPGPHVFGIMLTAQEFCIHDKGDGVMPKNCAHPWIAESSATESFDEDGVLVNRVESCVMCGYRRAVVERSGERSEGSWEPFRLSVTPDPSI